VAERTTPDRVFITPATRRVAVLDVISRARERLVLSLFRCNDPDVLDGLAAALKRGVKVEALLTNRAAGGRKRLRKLWATLEGMGVQVHRFTGSGAKYHAKYVVADGRIALVMTLNPTRKCFTRSWDFVLETEERAVVRSLATLFALDSTGSRLLPRHRISPRLIIAPEGARSRMGALIASARHSIRVLDHKLSDPEIVALLRERRSKGVEVMVIGHQPIRSIKPHGKLVIIDDTRAVLGSLALSPLSLDSRREVSIVIDAPQVVKPLNSFYEELSKEAGPSITFLPGDRAA
jgi:cardiolipin synthase